MDTSKATCADCDDERLAARRGFRLTVTMLMTCFLFALVAQLPLTENISWFESQRGVFRDVWPQRWSFFAAATHSPTVVVYRVEPDEAVTTVETQQQSSAEGMWGISRASYSQTAEINLVIRDVPDEQWLDCRGRKKKCVDELLTNEPYRLDNAARFRTMCGEFALVEQDPTEWSRSEPDARIGVVGKAALVDLNCG